ncbi:AMP-binding protein [Streptomyces sp. BE303]|uniref:AMP-binding protein n=1 Tax=Streptomyces sp. BE303 TaxID=3002528 RepID=UPI002E797F4A|nr:AMP-binding protein [Streptomyces sp. BE303]MED7948970.1 AMP-binding protein [Streptomyces sp. BE303]
MPWRSLPGRIAEEARVRPQAPALLWHADEVSYAELHRMVGAAAARLAGLGLGPAEPVAMVAKKSPQAVAVVLACLMLRRPVLLPSAELGAETLAALVDRCGARRLPDPIQLTEGHEEFTFEGDHDPEDVALLLTTSGSTGLPKVVPLTGGAVTRFADWAAEQFGIGPESTVLNYAPLNFDLCLLDIWTTLSRGGCVSLVDQDLAANPAHLLAQYRARPVQVVQGVPMLYQLLTQAAAGDPALVLDGVEHALLTGDAVSARGFEPLPALLPKAVFHNVYGCTETNDSFLHTIDPADPMPYGTVPIGRPIDGVDALVLDEDGVELTGPGRGELVVSTPFQTAGYLDAELDRGVFSERAGTRYYRTGDLVRRHDDGVLTLEGRRDFVVKVRGVRINTAEVETALRSHPAVTEAAVIAVPDELAGTRLHAVVQRAEGGKLNSLTIRQHAAGLLPRVAIPATVELVDTPLPRTGTGKLDRKAVQRRLLQARTDRPDTTASGG